MAVYRIPRPSLYVCTDVMAAPAGSFCPACGGKLKPDSRYCSGCGRAVVPAGGFPWRVCPLVGGAAGVLPPFFVVLPRGPLFLGRATPPAEPSTGPPPPP